MEIRPLENRRALFEIQAAIRTVGTPRSQLSMRPPVNTTQSSAYKEIRTRRPGVEITERYVTGPVGFMWQPVTKVNDHRPCRWLIIDVLVKSQNSHFHPL